MEKTEAEKKIEAVKKEFQMFLNKNGIVVKMQISFPIYRQLPDDVKLALNILTKHGMNLSYFFEEKPKEEPKK